MTTRQVHHVRGRRGLRQVHAGAAAGRTARGARRRGHPHARARRLAVRRAGAGAAARSRRALARAALGGAAVLRCTRRPSGQDHPPGAGGGALGDLRPLLGFDPGLPGRRRRPGCARRWMRWSGWWWRRRCPSSPASSTCRRRTGWRGRGREAPLREGHRPTPIRSSAGMAQFHERLRAGYLAIAAAEPQRCVVVDGAGTPDAIAAEIWAHVEQRLLRGRALMARAPAPQEDEALPEADRLEGFPHPRETRALIGHETAERELAQAFAGGRMHHAWLIAGAGGHRQGDAGLSPGRPCAGTAERARSRRAEPRDRPRHLGRAPDPGAVASGPAGAAPAVRYALEAVRGQHSRRRGAAAQVVPRADGGGGQLARGDRRCRRRAQPQRRQRAAEIAGGAAHARAVPAGRVAAEPPAADHPLALPAAGSGAAGGRGVARGSGGGARRSRGGEAGRPALAAAGAAGRGQPAPRAAAGRQRRARAVRAHRAASGGVAPGRLAGRAYAGRPALAGRQRAALRGVLRPAAGPAGAAGARAGHGPGRCARVCACASG